MNLLAQALQPQTALPQDAAAATLVGRAWIEGEGPAVVRITPDAVFDLSRLAPTMSALLDLDDPAAAVRGFAGRRIGDTAAILANSACNARQPAKP